MELKDRNIATNIAIYDQTDCTLVPGELVDQSGIYEICHRDEPRASVILMRNTIFPYCRRCGETVRYKILELVPHISEDPDFQEDPPETDQVTKLVRQSAREFDKANYAGALYLANQAKTLASSYRGRLSLGSREGARPGETPFAVPIKLTMSTRGNVREGPGTGFPIAFAAEPGTALTGYSYADEWIRVSDDTGRSGWVFRSLVARP